MAMRTRTVICFGLLAVLIMSTAYARHDDVRVGCLSCHVRLPFTGGALLFRGSADALCGNCHRDRHGSNGGLSHPLTVVPSAAIPADMPLDDQGRIFCGTCHLFHEDVPRSIELDRYLLRRSSANMLCIACHKKR